MMRTLLHTRFRPLALADLPQIMEIEQESFPTMWPPAAYRRELQNKAARYVAVTEVLDAPPPADDPGGLFSIVRRRFGGGDTPGPAPERLLGFAGLWLMVGEAHVVTIAVREAFRRMGIGERLLIACIETALELDQEVVTLEVRKSNDAAIAMYAKYGFERAGVRPRYYTDNREDAVIMTTPEIASAGYRRLFESLRARHQAACPDLWA